MKPVQSICAWLFASAQAAITRSFSLGGSDTKIYFSQFSSRSRKSEIRVPGGSQAASLPGLQMAAFSLYPHMARNVSSLVSLLIRILLGDEGPTLMTSLNLNYFFRKGPTAKYNHARGQGCNV